MEGRAVSLTAYWQLVRDNRNFRLLWLAQIVSEIGDWLYAISIYSLLLQLTGSARSVALAVVLQVIPQLLVSPSAGVINDRLSRKQVMIFSDVTRAVVVLGMLLVRTADMVWLLYVLLFLETVLWGFFEPGRSAVLPNITKGPQVLVANALSSTTWSFNLAVGSALGGTAAALLGRDPVFILNSASFLFSALCLRAMRFEETHVDSSRPFRLREALDFTPVLEGVRYIRGDRRLLSTLMVKAGLGIMGTNLVILPVFGERVFPVSLGGKLTAERSGMLGMSFLMGSRGVGALLGPLISGYWAAHRHERLRLGILLGFLTGLIGYVWLGLAPALWIACLAIMFAHAGGSTIWVFSTTLLQEYAEDRFRGRVFSADFSFLVLSMALVSYVAGVAIDWGISVRVLAILTGLLAAIPLLAWARVLRGWPAAREVRTAQP